MFLNSRPDLYPPVRPAVSTRLLLARHGETDYNRQGRLQGTSDIPLNGKGRDQATRLAAGLKREQLAAVYTSTLQRAIETAQGIAVQHRLNVSRDERLNEIRLGQWEGLSTRDLAARYGQIWQAWSADPSSVTPPDGESLAQVQKRVLAVTREIALAFPGEIVCLVAHGMTNAVIRSHYLGIPLADALRTIPAQGEWEAIQLPYPFP